MTDDATGDPGTLRWDDEDATDDPTTGDAPEDDPAGSDDAELCRVSDPTCESCQ